MAEPENDSDLKRPSKRQSSGGDDDASSPKKPRTDQEESRDPGKKAYRDILKVLRELHSLSSKSDMEEEDVKAIQDCLDRLKTLCTQSSSDAGEVPNPMKVIQIHLKYVLLNSEKIREEDNVKNFLGSLEDSSASRSDKDDSVFVFLANFATELWYQWEDEEGQWRWTPDWKSWMPCSNTVVTGGQWKGETPAPENVEIIHYLDAIRPVPSDESYLPGEFDVIGLFKKLCGLKDSQINKCLGAVVATLRGVEMKSKNEHVKSLTAALIDLEKDVKLEETKE